MRDQLEARGHRVLTPSFDVDEPDKGATWHAENLVSTLRGTPYAASEMVCVAHSAGGIFLPLIAERCEARRIVFLAALIPRPGISILDQFRADRSMFNEEWIGQDPMIDEVALRFLYHDCSPERAQWALATRVSFYAKRAMEEPCPLVTWPAIPADYIVCTDDRTISPAWQRKAAREWLGVNPVELPGGHCPNVSRPEALAKLLEDCTMLTSV